MISRLIASLLLALLFAAPASARNLADLFAKVNDSMVVIYTVSKDYLVNQSGDAGYVHGLGSGVIISPEGFVLTAAHVVNMAEGVKVVLSDGNKYDAEVVSSVPSADVALLKLEDPPQNLAHARLGDSDQVRIGDEVIVLGAPYGAEHTLTFGHISAKRESRIFPEQLNPVQLIQTDAAINQGNSGGPMFNLQGEVIGVVSHILSKSGGYEGLGFAISSNTARSLLLEQDAMWFGWEMIHLSQEMAQALNVPQENGLLVQKVAVGSLADRMGIRAGTIPAIIKGQKVLLGGDIVLSIQGVRVSDDFKEMTKIGQAIVELPARSIIRLTVLRGGETMELSAAKRTGISQHFFPKN